MLKIYLEIIKYYHSVPFVLFSLLESVLIILDCLLSVLVIKLLKLLIVVKNNLYLAMMRNEKKTNKRCFKNYLRISNFINNS